MKLVVVMKIQRSAQFSMKEWKHQRVSRELCRRSTTKRPVRFVPHFPYNSKNLQLASYCDLYNFISWILVD